MEHVVRTIYGAQLQSALLLGIDYTVPEFTTLNEKLGIQSGVTAAPGIYPKARYFCIGNGGHYIATGSDGTPLMDISQHKATDAALFNQLPFVLRQLTDDIPPSQRQKYALRKEVTIGGVVYIAYYLRRVDMVDVGTKLENRKVSNGVVTTSDFTPTAANLAPDKTPANPTGVNTVEGRYVTCISKMPISFSAAEVEELVNACMILYGDINYAIISEIGLCSGIDKTISVSASTGSFNFSEAIQVQIVSHIGALHVMRYCTSGLEKIMDVGSNSPLYNIVTPTATT